MGKRKIIDTSQDAYKALDPQKLSLMHKKIQTALEDLGPSTYEQIADYWQEKPERVWKRMSEAERKGLIHRNGKRVGAKGVWALGPSPEPVKKRERVLKGKSVQDFSKAINQVKQSVHSQDQLFS